MTLGARLSETASEYPRRVALIFEGRRYSYRELGERAESLAAGLVSIGVSPGDSVAVLINNSPDFVFAYFAAVMAGASVVPLNTFLTVPELVYILKDSGSRTLICGAEFKDRAAALRDGVPSISHVVMAGGAADGALTMEGLMAKGGGEDTLPRLDDEDAPAAILYTSGTTGHPKGAVLTHGNLLSNAASCASAFKVTRGDRFLLFLPMFHAFAFLVCVVLPVSVGASVIILASVKPFSKVIKGVAFGRATFFVGIPPVYNILSTKRFPKLIMRLLPLRLCVSGAAPLPLNTFERFQANFPFPLLEGYGLTEASPVVSCNPLTGKRKPGSAGLPIPGVFVKVVDGEGEPLPAGEVGEITVRGPNVMKGYLGDEEATRAAIHDGWLHTGDLGRLDEEGYIYIVDRKKDLILVHGMNVYPREVEEALYAHPAVAEAAVVGMPDPHCGEIPKAYISLREGASLTEREVKEYLKGLVAHYKVPRQVEFLQSLPKNRTGKVLKRELKDRGRA